MSILSDNQIAHRCKDDPAMIYPFYRQQQRDGKISYGCSSYGYDIRIAKHFKVFTNVHGSIIDPKNFDERAFVEIEADYCLIPPNSFALARSWELFNIPRDILALCLGKSTYARCGILVNVTPLEPEWKGYLTIEISNTTPLPVKIYGGEGIAQIIFFSQFPECEVSYADRKGKYQSQTGITTAKL
jgi:dCTP deaminase